MRTTLFVLISLLCLASVHAASLAEVTFDKRVTLLDNTYNCGGDIRCEAYISLPVTKGKRLERTKDIFFSLAYLNGKESPYTIEYELGQYKPVQKTRIVTTCVPQPQKNGSVHHSCTEREETHTEQEIVWHGKKFAPGTNILHIWSDNKPADAVVDWNFLIPALRTNVRGVQELLSFDTRRKGWAVWGAAPPIVPDSFDVNTLARHETRFASWSPGQARADVVGDLRDGYVLLPNNTVNSTHTTHVLTNFSMTSFGTGFVGVFTNASTHDVAGTTASLVTGYSCVCRGGGNWWFLNAAVEWVHNSLVSCDLQRNYSVKVQYTGSRFQCKAWDMGTTEPAVWMIDHAYTKEPAFQGSQVGIVAETLNSGFILYDITTNAAIPTVQNVTPTHQRQIVVHWNTTHSTASTHVVNKSLTLVVDASTFNNSANTDFSDVRVKMVDLNNVDAQHEYMLRAVNATHANLTFNVNSDALGIFNGIEQYFLVWGNNTDGLTTSNSALLLDVSGAPTHYTFETVTAYREGGTGSSGVAEAIGRTGIIDGIQTLLPGAVLTHDQQLVIRLANGSQYEGTFDVFAQHGNKRWAFNYDQNTTDNFPVFANITPVFWVWQEADRTKATITADVIALINQTK